MNSFHITAYVLWVCSGVAALSMAGIFIKRRFFKKVTICVNCVFREIKNSTGKSFCNPFKTYEEMNYVAGVLETKKETPSFCLGADNDGKVCWTNACIYRNSDGACEWYKAK